MPPAWGVATSRWSASIQASHCLPSGSDEAAVDEALRRRVELPHHDRVAAAARKRDHAAGIGGRQAGRALPHPVLALLLRQPVDIQQHLPGRGIRLVGGERRAPPQPADMRLVLPEIVDVAGPQNAVGNAVRRLMDLEDTLVRRLVARVAGQNLQALFILLAHPGERLFALDVLEPEMGHARPSAAATPCRWPLPLSRPPSRRRDRRPQGRRPRPSARPPPASRGEHAGPLCSRSSSAPPEVSVEPEPRRPPPCSIRPLHGRSYGKFAPDAQRGAPSSMVQLRRSRPRAARAWAGPTARLSSSRTPSSRAVASRRTGRARSATGSRVSASRKVR
ncbi:MAG: hypothetical protein KatS3mg119_1422 [Rhodothalassiaceae bacterium]|nr:MAG: hypothetical protein KatS3mg119_1422 [Rhodothalassiaceae bacterium]